MRARILFLPVIIIMSFAFHVTHAQGVMISNDPSAPEPAALLHVYGPEEEGGNILFEGEFKDPVFQGPPPASYEGTRFMWYPDKAALRAGQVTGGEWNENQIGEHSVALGYNTTARGNFSLAAGQNTSATGINCVALGYNTTASVAHSTAMGYQTIASGAYSTSVGSWTVAPSGFETVIGRYNSLYSQASSAGWIDTDRLFVIGNGTASDSRSDAMVVLKNGRTGIGVSDPQAWLHVNAAADNNALRVQIDGITKLFMTASGGLTAGTLSSAPENGLYVFGEARFNQHVNIGTNATPEAALHVRHANLVNEGIRIQNRGANLRHWTLHTNNGQGTLILYSSISGDTPVGNFNGSTGAYTATSNRHLKGDITAMTNNTLEKLRELAPSRYRYLRDPDGQFTLGFIAEDVLPVFPELVESVGENGENLAINYAGFSVVAIKAIQEQQAMIQMQQETINKLKIQIAELEEIKLLINKSR